MPTPETLIFPDFQRALLDAGARLHEQTPTPDQSHKRRAPSLRRRNRARRVTLAVAIASAASAAIVAFVVGAGSDPRATATVGGEDQDFAIFDTPDTPASVASPPIDDMGLDGITRRNPHRLMSGNHEVWVTSGNGNYCVTFQRAPEGARPEGFAAACGARADTVAAGLFVTTRPAPGAGGPAWQVAALMPNGVTSVTFDIDGGASRQVKVVSNVITADLDGLPLRARFMDASGRERVQRLGDR